MIATNSTDVSYNKVMNTSISPLLKVLFVLGTYSLTLSLGGTARAVPFEGQKMLVAAPSPYAVETAKKVMARGGNVVDVAVAMGLTLSVTSPYFAALGGGGLAVLRVGHQTFAVDFRETAPQSMSPTTFTKKPKEASIHGGLAVGVPGFPAGLYELHKKFGKLSWQSLFAEPLRLASEGFHVSGEWVRNTQNAKADFNKSGRRYFFKKNDTAYGPGEVLKQPELARALSEFRAKNIRGFYEGAVAKDIVDSVKEAGGDLTLKDLKNYRVRWLEPMKTQFNGYTLYLMPPPSSGGVLIQTALKLVEDVEVLKEPAMSVTEYHLLGEILSRAFRGRSLLGDPAFVKNPLEMLLSDKYLKEMTESISKRRTRKMDAFKDDAGKESTETTHYSVLDSEGNAVALTVTLNGDYGSGVVSEKFGIALNNEINDFATRPNEPNMFGLIQGTANRVEGGKRPLSSMSPTLVEKDGRVIMSVGAPGGPRIVSGVFQALYRVLGRGLNMDQAIQAARVHDQFLPRKLFVERGRFTPETIEGLKNLGHEVEETFGVARVYGVRVSDHKTLEAAFDSRGEGAAGGY